MITRKFKKGQRIDTDTVYHLLGIIPVDAYKQDDPADYSVSNGNDGGESVLFIKDVTVKYSVTTT